MAKIRIRSIDHRIDRPAVGVGLDLDDIHHDLAAGDHGAETGMLPRKIRLGRRGDEELVGAEPPPAPGSCPAGHHVEIDRTLQLLRGHPEQRTAAPRCRWGSRPRNGTLPRRGGSGCHRRSGSCAPRRSRDRSIPSWPLASAAKWATDWGACPGQQLGDDRPHRGLDPRVPALGQVRAAGRGPPEPLRRPGRAECARMTSAGETTQALHRRDMSDSELRLRTCRMIVRGLSQTGKDGPTLKVG